MDDNVPSPADTAPTRLTLAFDMRAPAFGADPVALYRAALEQCAWADSVGFTDALVMEHHASSDGYLPSPIVMGSAIAGVTHTLAIRLCLVLLPLYDPLRAAEDLAVLDLISSGRLRLTVGLGYREEEYEQFDVPMKRRPSLMEEAVETLKLAWTGEPFEYRGRQVRILPRPAQRPRPQIAMGGASPASAKRAARIADLYEPVVPKLYEVYLAELESLGKPAPVVRRHMSVGEDPYVFVADDPDPRMGPDRAARPPRHQRVRPLDRRPSGWRLRPRRRSGGAADVGELPGPHPRGVHSARPAHRRGDVQTAGWGSPSRRGVAEPPALRGQGPSCARLSGTHQAPCGAGATWYADTEL